MIPRPVLAAWRRRTPWRDDLQVEQDLLLSALAITVATNETTGPHLVWRGGTCLHKLHLEQARRYSEDLDYVLVGEVDHGDVLYELRQVSVQRGLEPQKEEVSPRAVKLWSSAEATAGGTITVKFEVNCDDRDPLFDLQRLPHSIETRWWEGGADILTFDPCELVGTKFRALAQRRKGRDLSDLWLARRELGLDDERLAAAADHYLEHEGITPGQLRARLAEHLEDQDFVNDLDELVVTPYEGFDVVTEARRLILWCDENLDVLADARRSRSARRREQREMEAQGWFPGKVRCPVYGRSSGNLSRCGTWLEPGEECPAHPDAPTSVRA
ncbi:MAG: nucleotidyl transferase AbiEii/AbiGii toxin family protein [Nitriliruptorales bacterium]|nr:nucleotidyl transferase AbiEii/AbiGii toxin family protein [Nitriliruptorales bacterium]